MLELLKKGLCDYLLKFKIASKYNVAHITSKTEKIASGFFPLLLFLFHSSVFAVTINNQ